MLNKNLRFLFLFLLISKLNGQNLVKNGSFELCDFWKCESLGNNPNNINDPYGKLSFITSYYRPESGVRGLFSKAISSGTCAAICGALTNTISGYKAPRSGNNLVFGVYDVAFELTAPLIKNNIYVFECYFSASNKYKTNTPFSFYKGAPNFNFGQINPNDSTTGFLVIDFLKNPSEMFQAQDAFIINNIKKIDTLGWTKISACFTPKTDSIKYISFHSNIYAFMDDISIFPSEKFNINQVSKPCNKNFELSIINPSPNYIYTYNFGDNTIINTSIPLINHTYSLAGIYNGFLMGKDTLSSQYFCSATSANISFVKANFTVPQVLISEIKTSITNLSENAESFNWFLNGTFQNFEKNPEIIFNPGLNRLCLKSKDHIGCIDSICREYNVEKCGEITNANIFTPNDDGINDFFYFFNSEPCDTSMIKIIVYNRWGEEFYRYPVNTLFKANEPHKYFIPTKFYTSKYWNGFSFNIGPEKADAGIYFIVIETPNETKTKTISLLR